MGHLNSFSNPQKDLFLRPALYSESIQAPPVQLHASVHGNVTETACKVDHHENKMQMCQVIPQQLCHLQMCYQRRYFNSLLMLRPSSTQSFGQEELLASDPPVRYADRSTEAHSEFADHTDPATNWLAVAFVDCSCDVAG